MHNKSSLTWEPMIATNLGVMRTMQEGSPFAGFLRMIFVVTNSPNNLSPANQPHAPMVKVSAGSISTMAFVRTTHTMCITSCGASKRTHCVKSFRDGLHSGFTHYLVS